MAKGLDLVGLNEPEDDILAEPEENRREERKRVDRIVDGLEPDHWRRLAVGDGSKEPRTSDWAHVEVPNLNRKGRRTGWLFDGAGCGRKTR
ncbi:MAG: hypothetical protein NVSMB49_23020 [Ktedonobacteraceae bacterium]